MEDEHAPAPGYDREAVARHLDATTEELRLYIDEAHMTYLPIYLGRADARHVLGHAPKEVLRELWRASRCYAEHGSVYLTKWPRHQLRRRRLLPFEVALVAGDEDVLATTCRTFGLDAITLLAGMEPETLTHEVRTMTPYFLGGRLADRAEMAGLLAVCYWLALSAVAEGETKSFDAARGIAAKAMADFPAFTGPRAGGLGRMLAIHQALGSLTPAVPEAFVDAIAEHGRLHHAGLPARVSSEATVPTTGAGALDTSALTLLAIAAAVGVNVHAPLSAAAETDAALADVLAYAELLGHTASA